jgi:hypothetical protein
MSKELIIICILMLLYIINKLNKSIKVGENFNDVNKKEYDLPKIIYAFWDDLDKNPLVKSCINSWRRHLSAKWQIVVLNKDNVYKYVEPEFIKKYGSGTIDSTRFADFLRIDLLQKRGGVWMDACIFITSGKFLDDMHDEMTANKYDACFYEYKENTLLPSQPHIDNWFMMAPKGSKIITDLYREFDRGYDMGFVKYKESVIIPSDIILDKTIGLDPENTYLMQHAIFHYLFKIGNHYDIILKNATESMYRIHQVFDWDHEKIVQFILENENWKNLYGVKLTKGTRSAILNIPEFCKKIDSL